MILLTKNSKYWRPSPNPLPVITITKNDQEHFCHKAKINHANAEPIIATSKLNLERKLNKIMKQTT